MNQDAFDDATADLGDAIERFQDELCFDGDRPSVNKMKLIRSSWSKLASKFDDWLDALATLEGPR